MGLLHAPQSDLNEDHGLGPVANFPIAGLARPVVSEGKISSEHADCPTKK